MATATALLTETEPATALQQIQLQNIDVDAGLSQQEGALTGPVCDQIENAASTRKSLLKVLAASMSFFFAGNNDGSLGALTPYILRTYSIGTGYIAFIYGATFLGWLFAAATNGHMARYLGLGTILTLGAGIQVVAHALRCWTPPFPLFVVTFFLQAVGMAYNESHANTFVASLKSAHRPLGFIHAMYALGTLVSPFVATGIASAVPNRWAIYYVYLVGIGVLNMLAVGITFRESLKMHTSPASPAGQTAAVPSRRKQGNEDVISALKSPPVYLLSMFYFFMLGTGITASGWVVEYLIEARNGKLPEVGYIPAALAGGIFLGRIILAEPTHRYGERRMTLAYCVIMLCLQLIFWLVPNFVSSTVSLCFLGFFFGPMFATGMSVGSKLFSKELQPTALGYVFVLAQAGGSFFPAITGIIAGRAGVKVMQPMLVGLIVATGISWALVPRVKHRDV
jgi:fucose permease